MKTCSKCLEIKPLPSFYKERESKDGHRNQCKVCRDGEREKRRDQNRAAYNAWHVKYMKEHPLSRRQKDQQTSRVLKCRYGITLEEYEKMLEAQGGHCAMCKRTRYKNRRLAVDHNHTTGAIRGILCDGCNIALAILENPPLLAKAMAYLAK
jgi:hypothetical protein